MDLIAKTTLSDKTNAYKRNFPSDMVKFRAGILILCSYTRPFNLHSQGDVVIIIYDKMLYNILSQ